MTASETAAGTVHTTSAVVRTGLGILGVFQAIIGFWTLLAPTRF